MGKYDGYHGKCRSPPELLNEQDRTEEPPVAVDAAVDVILSADRLRASLIIKPPKTRPAPSLDLLKSALSDYGVVFGVMSRSCRSFLKAPFMTGRFLSHAEKPRKTGRTAVLRCTSIRKRKENRTKEWTERSNIMTWVLWKTLERAEIMLHCPPDGRESRDGGHGGYD
jgi:hypothetical protein